MASFHLAPRAKGRVTIQRSHLSGYRGDARSLALAPAIQAWVRAMLAKRRPFEAIDAVFPGVLVEMNLDYRRYPASAPEGWDYERYRLWSRAMKGEDVQGPDGDEPNGSGGGNGGPEPSPARYDEDEATYDHAASRLASGVTPPAIDGEPGEVDGPVPPARSEVSSGSPPPSPRRGGRRSRFSVPERRRILAEYDAAKLDGGGAPVLERYGITRTTITQWRRKLAA